MATVEELKAKAKDMELHGVNFLDEGGNYVSGGNGRELHHIDFIFIDGDVLTIDGVHSHVIDDIVFKLVPGRKDA